MKRNHPSDDDDDNHNLNAEQDTTIPRTDNSRPDGLIQRPPPTAVYGRVKLKLKTTPKPAAVEVQLQSDPGMSSDDNKVDDYKDKMVDGGNKIGGIKIISFKTSSPSGRERVSVAPAVSGGDVSQNLSSGTAAGGEESGGSVLFVEEKKVEEHESRRREVKYYNKKELDASLEVIRKIMRMDAAEPFNVPVDPVGLNIPDYFDVIDTPMDFGTIRNNLEGGTKYMDSEDVYKDVQLIWDNCYRYNSKGDLIVDLMKRVKKNFMKYWMAAGLYTEQTNRITGAQILYVFFFLICLLLFGGYMKKSINE